MSKTVIAFGVGSILVGPVLATFFGPGSIVAFGILGSALLIYSVIAKDEDTTDAVFFSPLQQHRNGANSQQGKPRLHIADKGFYADTRELREINNGRLLSTLSCIHVRFKNDPLQPSPSSIAKILAEIEYFDSQNNLLSSICGRWGDTTQPPVLPPSYTVEDNLTNVVIHIGQVRELDVAFKYQDEEACYAMSNETYGVADWRHPSQKLPLGTIRARVRLRGADVDDSWDLWFENPVTGQLKPLRHQVAQQPKPPPPQVPRPQIAVTRDESTLRRLVLTNVGERAAHNIRIVPDKSLGVWLEQVGNIDMMPQGGSPHVAEIAAMSLNDRGQEEPLYNSTQKPLEAVAIQLILNDVNPPRLPFAVEYDGSGAPPQHYVTRYRWRLDSVQNPSIEYIDG